MTKEAILTEKRLMNIKKLLGNISDYEYIELLEYLFKMTSEFRYSHSEIVSSFEGLLKNHRIDPKKYKYSLRSWLETTSAAHMPATQFI